jgi:hypothetical protein
VHWAERAPGRGKFRETSRKKEQIDRLLPGQVATFDDDGARAQPENPFRRLASRAQRVDLDAGQFRGLVNVRRDHSGEGQEPSLQY